MRSYELRARVAIGSRIVDLEMRLREAREHSRNTAGLRGRRLVELSASFGVANLASVDVPTLDALIQQADAALYQAKADGRNRVCTAAHVNAL